MLSSDSPAKTTKTSINIAFLSPFHVKHRLKSHISTPLNPSALPHDRRQQTTKHIGQCKHAPFILRDHSAQFTRRAALHTISRRFEHTYEITLDTQQRQALFAQCRATARAMRIHLRYSHATTRRVPSKRTFATLPLRPVLLYIITLRCFPSHFLLFLFLFGRSCGRQNSSSGSIYSNASPLPARRPTNPFACRPHTLLRSAMRRHSASARFSRPFRAPSAMSAAAFAAELPFDTPSRLFRLPLFPQAVQGSAFLCVLVSCGTHALSFTKTSTFIEVFARLCIFIHCVIACFSPIRLLFPSLRSFPRCRSAADNRASAPLSYTRFRIPPSRTRAVSSIRVCILFPRSSLSSPIFSISFHLTLAIGVTFALFACTFL